MGVSKQQSWFEGTLQPTPETRSLPVQLLELEHQSWGFSIYRTSYEPAQTSNLQWETLLAKISEQAVAAIDQCSDQEDIKLASRLKDLFVIDPWSDPEFLAGKSRPEIRELHMRRLHTEDEARAADKDEPVPVWPGRDFFLLADAEVLNGVSNDPFFWVKCVAGDHDEEEAKRRIVDPRRLPAIKLPHVIEGWFRMTTRSVVDLCEDLRNCDFGYLPPPQSDQWRDLLIYNGELFGLNPEDAICSGK